MDGRSSGWVVGSRILSKIQKKNVSKNCVRRNLPWIRSIFLMVLLMHTDSWVALQLDWGSKLDCCLIPVYRHQKGVTQQCVPLHCHRWCCVFLCDSCLVALLHYIPNSRQTRELQLTASMWRFFLLGLGAVERAQSAWPSLGRIEVFTCRNSSGPNRIIWVSD